MPRSPASKPTAQRWIACIVAALIAALVGVRAAGARDATPIKLAPGETPEQFCRLVQAAFAGENFDTLEATAERARSLTTRFSGGKAELQVFYDSLSTEKCTDFYLSMGDQVAKARVALVEHWLQQKPDSLTARIASAVVWEEFAWTARGTGFSNEISQEQWALFGDRARRAAQFMRNVDPASDAHAYLVLLHLARDLSVPRPQIDAVYREARERYPTYLGYYPVYANLILPKWFGAPGEIAAFTKSLLADPGGDTGAMAYSRVAEWYSWEHHGTDIYSELGLAWPDIQHGFALRESQYGLDKYAWISLCYYATVAGDRDAAREAFRHVTHLDSWPEGGRKTFYLTVLPWIMSAD
jgi:hypothetical protein